MKDINFFPILLKQIKYTYVFFYNLNFIYDRICSLNTLKINKLSEKMIKFQEVAEDQKVLERIKIINSEEEKLNDVKLEVELIGARKELIDKKTI